MGNFLLFQPQTESGPGRIRRLSGLFFTVITLNQHHIQRSKFLLGNLGQSSAAQALVLQPKIFSHPDPYLFNPLVIAVFLQHGKQFGCDFIRAVAVIRKEQHLGVRQNPAR